MECGSQFPLRALRTHVMAFDGQTVPRCEKILEDNISEGEDLDVLTARLEALKVTDPPTSPPPQDGHIAAPRKTKKCGGVIKPDIVFFGESLPHRFGALSSADMREADLLIVIGTSLVVYPFAGLIAMADVLCPRVLINKEPSAVYQPQSASGGNAGFRFFEDDNYRDIYVAGDCDLGVEKICELCGWTNDLKELEESYVSQADAFDRLIDLQEGDT
eukprot:GHVO01027589.1.p2 GENE.GHVO01027589.1~~GHVO01027589.1.p2  ORF type:complete len:217 (+),score=57.21 GHVO01027589.1:684-1334(+)